MAVEALVAAVVAYLRPQAVVPQRLVAARQSLWDTMRLPLTSWRRTLTRCELCEC